MKEKELFKEIIASFHNSDLPDVYEREIRLPYDIDKIISVIGVRRSGKTFLFFQTMKKLLEKHIPINKIIYINFEDERIENKPESFEAILEAYRELYPEISLKDVYFFFDEIQNITGWEKFVRRLNDRYTKKIFITGSNSKFLSKEIATSLRGRTLTYELYPLSFKEYLYFNSFSFDKKDLYDPEKKAMIKSYFSQYLLFGGFPELVFIEDKNIKIRILQEYFNVMIYRDLIERYEIKSVSILKYFLKRIIEGIGKPVSVNNIYNELKSQGKKISKATLYNFFEMLENIYMIMISKRYVFSVLKQEVYKKKAYLTDNGLVNAITYKYKDDYEKLLENLVAKEIKSRGFDLFYNTNNSECDFVLVSDKKKIPVQVSYSLESRRTFKREVKGVSDFMNKYKGKKGFILTYDEKNYLNENGFEIEIIPAYEFILRFKDFIF